MLFDLLAPSPGVAPWRLTLHFRAYPCTMLAPWEGEPSLRAAFLNSLKEAAFVARGSVQRVMEMSAGAQADLWAAAADGRLAAYAQVGGMGPCLHSCCHPRNRCFACSRV